jgi:hypothetical protein
VDQAFNMGTLGGHSTSKLEQWGNFGELKGSGRILK